MSVVKASTKFPYYLYDLWKDGVDKEARQYLADIYIAFVSDDHQDTYIYFPLLHLPGKLTESDVPDLGITPVMCSPDIDMSTATLRELLDASGLPLQEAPLLDTAIEDIVLGSILEPPSSVIVSPLVSVIDDWHLQYLCMFVAKSGTERLRSFVKQIFVRSGYEEEYGAIFPGDKDLTPANHTIVELTSEMMRSNKDMYMMYKYKDSVTRLESMLSLTMSKPEIEYCICGLVYDMLCDSVVTCMGKLWCFVNGIWVECSSDGYLWNFLTRELIEYLIAEGAEQVASHIKSVHTRTRLLKDIRLRLQDDSFESMLNSRRDIIRMTNGVYNTGDSALSDPVPSDYVSVIAGVGYQIFDDRSSEVTQLMGILGAIFPEKDLLDFFMLSCSTFLEGFNANKVFYIWWGTGNNAKSLVQALVMKAFGDYCSTAPTSLITGKRTSSSNATPELCHVENKLVVFLQEPNPDEKIKAGMIKEMTGNDRMYTRQLFKSGKTMMFKAKIVIVCNNVMEIMGIDAALRRRIVVVPFISTFLDRREYSTREAKGTLGDNSYTIDPSIEKRLIKCSSAFMYLLCRIYHNCRGELKVPQIITDITEDYITRNNYPLIFIRSFVHQVYGTRSATTEVYEMFKEWFKRSYPNKRVADLEVFTGELASEGYKDEGGIIDNMFLNYTGDLL